MAQTLADFRRADDGLSELRALANIISSSVDRMEEQLRQNNVKYPSLYTRFSQESEAPRAIPEIRDASAVIAAAAGQLVAAVCPPPATIFASVSQFTISSALSVAAESHVAEILRDAGLEGKHVDEIARPTGVDPRKLARFLRLLATQHIFLEVAPDTFAHSRLSSVLDTGKSVEDILQNPKKKHIGTLGITAAVGHLSDEVMKSVSYLPETIMDPVSGHLDEVPHLAYNRAFNRTDDWWGYFEDPDNSYRMSRFAATMDGTKNMAPPNAVASGFDWQGLGKDALVVDVGGGIGSQSLTLAKNFPDLKFVVQDREGFLKEAGPFWEAEVPGAQASGRVKFQSHDFYSPQPVKDADVFLVRMIMHDYPDNLCLNILRHLREAAKPTTQLVVIDNIVGYACEEPGVDDIAGAAHPPPPAPLLPNLGQANIIPYLMDMEMLAIVGGQERTLTQFRQLLAEGGWKVVGIDYGTPFVLSHQKVIAVPM